jgi:hypothetical protein
VRVHFPTCHVERKMTMTTSSQRYNHLVQADISKPMDGA